MGYQDQLVFLGLQPNSEIRGSYRSMINLRYGPISRPWAVKPLSATVVQVQVDAGTETAQPPPPDLRVHTARPTFDNEFAYFQFHNVPVVGQVGESWMFEANVYENQTPRATATTPAFQIVSN